MKHCTKCNATPVVALGLCSKCYESQRYAPKRSLSDKRVNNIRCFIKTPKAGDIIRVYLEDGQIKHAVAVGLIKRNGERQRVKARLIDKDYSLNDVDFCFDEKRVKLIK